MDQINFRKRLTKRGSLAILLVVIVVVMFIMSAIISLLLSITHKQSRVATDFQTSVDLLTVTDIIAMQGQNYLKKGIEDGTLLLSDLTDPLAQGEFMASVMKFIPTDLQSNYEITGVELFNGHEVYKHGELNHGYDLITVKIKYFEHGEEKTCYVGFFQANSAGFANAGANYSEGDFVITWKQ